MSSHFFKLLWLNLYNAIEDNCRFIMPSLQSSEVHIEAELTLRFISRLEEIGFKFQAKNSGKPQEVKNSKLRDQQL